MRPSSEYDCLPVCFRGKIEAPPKRQSNAQRLGVVPVGDQGIITVTIVKGLGTIVQNNRKARDEINKQVGVNRWERNDFSL